MTPDDCAQFGKALAARAARVNRAGRHFRCFVREPDRWVEVAPATWLDFRRSARAISVLGIEGDHGPLAARVHRDSAHLVRYLNEERNDPDGSNSKSAA